MATKPGVVLPVLVVATAALLHHATASTAFNEWVANEARLKRQAHVLVPLGDGVVAAFGGAADEGVLASTWLRLPNETFWRPSPVSYYPPSPRAYTAAAAVGDHRAVMFGGLHRSRNNEETLDQETWNLFLNTSSGSPVAWWIPAKLGPHAKPAKRARHAMASAQCPLATGRNATCVVMFGGRTSLSPRVQSNDTWLYFPSNSTWLEITPPNSPSVRDNHKMATLDSHRVLLYGGTAGQELAILNDTWVFDTRTRNWTRVLAPGPPARAGFAMAQSSASSVLVFGGYSNTSESATWIFNGTTMTWSNVSNPSNQTPVASLDGAAAMVRDGVVLLFGGQDGQSFWLLDQTWQFVLPQYATASMNAGWTDLGAHSAPTERSGHALAVIGREKQTGVMFGGASSDGRAVSSTWKFNLQQPGFVTWERVNPPVAPAARSRHGIAPLSATTVLLFGGVQVQQLGDTWIFDSASSTWERVLGGPAPSPRIAFGMAPVDDNVVLLVSGLGQNALLTDSWVFDGSTRSWRPLSPAGNSVSMARTGHALATCGGVPVVFGGRDETGSVTSGLFMLVLGGGGWSHNTTRGTWEEITNAAASVVGHGVPVARSEHAMTSVGDTRLAMFGGVRASGSLDDLWVLQLNTVGGGNAWEWELLSTNSQSPPSRSLTSIAAVTGASLLLFGGMAPSRISAYADTWTVTLGCSPGTYVGGNYYDDSPCLPCERGTFTNETNRFGACSSCRLPFLTTRDEGAWTELLCSECNETIACSGAVCVLDDQAVSNYTGAGGLPYACLCKPGYWGTHCQGTCHGGTDPPCNGHGRCNDTALGDGTCTCDFAYRFSAHCRTPVMQNLIVGLVVGTFGTVGLVVLGRYLHGLQSDNHELVIEAQHLGSKMRRYQRFAKVDLEGAEFKSVIGSGANSVVWRGTVPRLNPDREYALKELPDPVPMFDNADVEGLGLVKGHPRFVELYGVGSRNNEGFTTLVIVTELVKGGSLFARLTKAHQDNKPFPWSQRVQVIIDVAEALQYLHSEGVLHGDIKSLNVLLDDADGDCRAKLADFGLTLSWRERDSWGRGKSKKRVRITGASSAQDQAYQALPGPSTPRRSVPFAPRGTLRWCAPELFQPDPKGVLHTSLKVDVYAFGVLVWEILQCTGEAPRPELSNSEEVQRAVCEGKPLEVDAAKLEGAPPTLLGLMSSCTHVIPDERPDFDHILAQVQALKADRAE